MSAPVDRPATVRSASSRNRAPALGPRCMTRSADVGGSACTAATSSGVRPTGADCLDLDRLDRSEAHRRVGSVGRTPDLRVLAAHATSRARSSRRPPASSGSAHTLCGPSGSAQHVRRRRDAIALVGGADPDSIGLRRDRGRVHRVRHRAHRVDLDQVQPRRPSPSPPLLRTCAIAPPGICSAGAMMSGSPMTIHRYGALSSTPSSTTAPRRAGERAARRDALVVELDRLRPGVAQLLEHVEHRDRLDEPVGLRERDDHARPLGRQPTREDALRLGAAPQRVERRLAAVRARQQVVALPREVGRLAARARRRGSWSRRGCGPGRPAASRRGPSRRTAGPARRARSRGPRTGRRRGPAPGWPAAAAPGRAPPSRSAPWRRRRRSRSDAAASRTASRLGRRRPGRVRFGVGVVRPLGRGTSSDVASVGRPRRQR